MHTFTLSSQTSTNPSDIHVKLTFTESIGTVGQAIADSRENLGLYKKREQQWSEMINPQVLKNRWYQCENLTNNILDSPTAIQFCEKGTAQSKMKKLIKIGDFQQLWGLEYHVHIVNCYVVNCYIVNCYIVNSYIVNC